MKASDIRDWDNVEILARLEELKEEEFRLRFRLGTMELENPKVLQHIRRDVARLNTILRERALADATGSADEAPEIVDQTPEPADESTDTDTETEQTPQTAE